MLFVFLWVRVVRGYGGVAFSGEKPLFDNLKIGYDNNSDNDLNDAGDDLVVDETFGATSVSPVYDHAGNLVDDGAFRYVYDAWNRLIKAQSSKDGGAVTFQTAEFDGLGRRISKTVTNSGDFDGTFKYNCDGQRIVQVNNGSNAMVQQFIHGTQYMDELVTVRVKDKGDLYVHQDANWNVIGLTDLGRHLVERYVFTPYGELMVNQETGYGDRDGDADVDSTDKGTVGTTCIGTVTGSCRILDLDFDGDYDSADATKFDALPQGAMHNPGLTASAVSQPFAHQGLLFEPEIGSYQNRARQYDPGKKRFAQRDHLRQLVPGGPYSDGMSTYAYVRQTPALYRDPTGTMATSIYYPKPYPRSSNKYTVSLSIAFWGLDADTLAPIAQSGIQTKWTGHYVKSRLSFRGSDCVLCSRVDFRVTARIFHSPDCDSHTGGPLAFNAGYFGGDCAKDAMAATGSTISIWLRPVDSLTTPFGDDAWGVAASGGNVAWVSALKASNNLGFFQVGAAHEVGHLLGVGHDDCDFPDSATDLMDSEANQLSPRIAKASCCNVAKALKFHGVPVNSLDSSCCDPGPVGSLCSSGGDRGMGSTYTLGASMIRR